MWTRPRLSKAPALVLVAAFGASCASNAPKSETVGAATVAPPLTEETSASPEVAVTPPPDGAPAAPERTQPAPEPPTPVALCLRMCDLVKERCSESAVENCHMNCSQYEHPPAGCDIQVRAALECGAKATDVACVNIAPESCAPEFRRVVACASGKPDVAPVDPLKLPEGWQRYESASQGFAAPMPSTTQERASAPEPTFTATLGEATYSVRVLPEPKEKPTQKSLVKVSLALLGNCARKLKLFGMVERPDRVSIRYESRCPNASERHGALVIGEGKMYVLDVSGPAGFESPKDPFFYGFELK